MFDKHFMQKSMYKKARSDRFIFFSSMLLNVCSPRHEAHMIEKKKWSQRTKIVNKGVLSQNEFSLNKQRQEDAAHNLISAWDYIIFPHLRNISPFTSRQFSRDFGW